MEEKYINLHKILLDYKDPIKDDTSLYLIIFLFQNYCTVDKILPEKNYETIYACNKILLRYRYSITAGIEKNHKEIM